MYKRQGGSLARVNSLLTGLRLVFFYFSLLKICFDSGGPHRKPTHNLYTSQDKTGKSKTGAFAYSQIFRVFYTRKPRSCTAGSCDTLIVAPDWEASSTCTATAVSSSMKIFTSRRLRLFRPHNTQLRNTGSRRRDGSSPSLDLYIYRNLLYIFT